MLIYWCVGNSTALKIIREKKNRPPNEIGRKFDAGIFKKKVNDLSPFVGQKNAPYCGGAGIILDQTITWRLITEKYGKFISKW